MQNDPSFDPKLLRLISVKRLETPPPGFHDYLRGRIMHSIAIERQRIETPWWARLFEEMTWQRGMAAANLLALTGVGILGVATLQVAHSVANEEEEGQVYAALPLPAESLHRPVLADPEVEPVLTAATVQDPFRPLPANGGTAPVSHAFLIAPEPQAEVSDPPKWLFKPAVGFHLASDRDRR